MIGGSGNDELRQTQDSPAVIDGGAGNDRIAGGAKDDRLTGGDGKDTITGGTGADRLDGGAGDDSLSDADGGRDWLGCGDGRDSARADKVDVRSACEKVTYGKAGKPSAGPPTPAAPPLSTPTAARVRGTRVIHGHGGLVGAPGAPGVKVDRRIVADIRWLQAKYRVAVSAQAATTAQAAAGALSGLSLEIVPAAGGSWSDVDRLAKWAEPSPNHARAPFSRVGYHGDPGHGRGTG